MKRLHAALTLLTITFAATSAMADMMTFTPSADATICEDPMPLANGAGEYIFAGRTDEPTGRRALVAFDVAAGIPAGATITSVSLTLELTRSEVAGPEPVSLHRLESDWGEGPADPNRQEGRCADAAAGDATWDEPFFGGGGWMIPGGDYVPLASATQTIGTNLGPYTWTSTPELVADVQAWLDDPAASFGWILIGNEAGQGTAKRFSSSDSTAAAHPLLTVEFTPGSAGNNVFESNDKTMLGTQIGTATASPYDVAPAADALLYYRVNDIDPNPPVINLVKGGMGVLIYW